MSSSSSEECHKIFKPISDSIPFIPSLKILPSYTKYNERKLWICTWVSKRSNGSLHMHCPLWVWLTICWGWIYSLKNSSSPWYSMSDVVITFLYLLCFKGGFGQIAKSHSNLEHLFLLQRHDIVSTQLIILQFKGLSLFWKDLNKCVQHISSVWFSDIKWKIKCNSI